MQAVRTELLTNATRLGGDLERGSLGGTFRRRRPDPHPIDPFGVTWVCARVRNGREFAVTDELRLIGYRSFCPHGVRVSYRARVHGSDQRKRMERDFPVFGCYVFVGVPSGFVLTKDSHHHLFAVLENAGGSRAIPVSFVIQATSLWLSRHWDGRGRPPISASPGDTVKLGELDVVIDSLPSETQAIVRFAMFGKNHTERVDIARLEAV